MKYISLFIVLFVLIFTNCSKDKEISLFLCGEENPEWVLKKIESLTNRVSNRPVDVYSVNINSIEYIAITDFVNSSVSDGMMFFLCSGEQIEYASEKYEELKLLFEKEAFKLIWSNS